jgi:uncharacterized protein with PQ loop repeat
LLVAATPQDRLAHVNKREVVSSVQQRVRSMANLLSVIGYIGTGLVIGAYAPQISHLWTEHCSAGISERGYALWALAAALFLGHSTVIGDTVFMITQLVNMVALAIILVLARRFRNQICAAHARQLHVRE